MIRNVSIHVANEQPLLADLYTLPAASDAGLVCTNVRSLDGKRPVFVDDAASTFFFPYHVVRFLEIPAGALKASGLDSEPVVAGGAMADVVIEAQPPANGDERGLTVAGGPGDGAEDAPDGDPDLDIEIDEGFLQRIRDI